MLLVVRLPSDSVAAAAGSQISDAVQNNDGNENSSVQGNDTKEETLPEMPDIPNSTD